MNHSSEPTRSRTWPIALLLVLVAPVVAELCLGTLPLSQAYVVLAAAFPYGCGAVLIREVARRRGLGLLGLLTLGLAYGVLEEGLLLRSLTSTTIYPVDDWAPRLFGLNTAFSLMVLPYHAVFSIVLPILLVELLVPAGRDRPYLRTPGLVVAAVGFVIGLGLLRLTSWSLDPGHTEPGWRILLTAAVVVGLVGLALALPRPAPTAVRVPRPAGLLAVGGLGSLGYFGVLMPLQGPGTHSSGLPFSLSWIPAALALLALPLLVALAARWARSERWTGTHSAWLVTGLLATHTVLGLLTQPLGLGDRLGLAGLGLGQVVVGLLLVRRTRSRADARPAPPAETRGSAHSGTRR